MTKRFSGTTALAGVDFAVEPGRVHALIGENGAGKSTLVKILAGVEQPTSGELLFEGDPVQFASPRDAGRLGIDIIHQELQLFPDLSIEENLFVGRERLTRWGTIDRAAQRTAATAALERLGQRLAIDRRVGSLPLGQQQIVEIARAVVHETRVLMMDEPTSALTASEMPVLFNVIRDLAAHGVGIVYISHRLEELLAVADTVTVLRDGLVVGHAARADVDVPWIVRRMTGADAPAAAAHGRSASGAPILAVKDLQLPAAPGRTGLRDVTFDVRPGEILGLYGLMGAGRTELMECLLGVHDGRARQRSPRRPRARGRRRSRTDRAGHRHGSRGSPGVGPDPDDERAAEHDAGASRRAGAGRLPVAGARNERGSGMGGPPSRQDARASMRQSVR